MTNEEFKKLIMEMLKNIEDTLVLKKICTFIKTYL